MLQQLIEAELTAAIGARPHERSDTRTAQRNGHRPKLITTAAGDIELQVPKLREGSLFPALLERRRRIDRALFAASVLRLVTAVVVETHDEWQVAERRYLSEESMAAIDTIQHTENDTTQELPLAITA